MSEPKSVPPPNEPSASPVVRQAGCVIACGLALLLMLYVGSFLYLVADGWNQWGITASLDEDILNIVYAPLVWLCHRAIEVIGFRP